MNNYPIWWYDTITIFNKFTDSQTQVVTWYRTVLDNCFWKAAGNKVTIGDTTIDSDNIICRIPKDSEYKTPGEWIQLPNDTKSNWFTLKPEDIIVLGNVTDDIDEYVKGKRSSDLLNKYKKLQSCMVVERVANNTGLGKCNEHYFASGV